MRERARKCVHDNTPVSEREQMHKTEEQKKRKKEEQQLKIIMHKLLHISHEFITHKKSKVPKNR